MPFGGGEMLWMIKEGVLRSVAAIDKGVSVRVVERNLRVVERELQCARC